MAEQTADYMKTGIIGVLLLTSIFGFIPEAEDTHICIEDGKIIDSGRFVRISSTKITAYPNENDNKGYRRCFSGWIEIDRSEPIKLIESPQNVSNRKLSFIRGQDNKYCFTSYDGVNYKKNFCSEFE